MKENLGVQLAAVMRTALGPDAVLESWERGPAGNGQEAWFCELVTPTGQRSLVVRRTATSGPLQWTDRHAEFEALRWLEPVPVPTPPVLHFEPGGGALDRAAIVMERMPGRPVRQESGEAKRRLAVDLGRRLAALHATPADGFPGPTFPDVAAATAAQVSFWSGRYQADALEPVPLVGALLAWMSANPLDRAGDPAVVWGDCGLHNLLHKDGEVTALLDWELVHLGDPLEDLGAAIWSASGVVDGEIVVRAYEAAADVEIDRHQLAWFVGFAALTRGIMILNGVRSMVEDPDPQPSMMGVSLDLLPKLLRQAAAAFAWPEASQPRSAAVHERATVLRPDQSEMLRAVAGYLGAEVVDSVTEPRVRRNAKTIAALIEVAALRAEQESGVAAVREEATAKVLASLGTAGVDVSGGLERVAVRIETQRELAPHRDAMRRHLLADQALVEALLGPLRRLYGA